MKVDKHIRDFAGRFYDALTDDSWGGIEPNLFQEIADGDEDTWDDDARSLYDAIVKTLGKRTKS